MTEPFIAEIRIFAGNFAPRGWALCAGQMLSISQHAALFSLLGTTYGGDGRTTFALPDLRGRVPMHPGVGPALTPRRLGATGGSTSHTLSVAEMGEHRHVARVFDGPGSTKDPGPTVVPSRVEGKGCTLPAPGSKTPLTYSDQTTGLSPLRELDHTGGGQPHDNMQPYLRLHFIIALVGIYPSRS